MPKLAADKAMICSLAARHLAQTRGVTDFDTDASELADACRVWYPVALDEVLRDFPWPFATTFAALALVTGPVPPATIEWTYSYRYPFDCVKMTRIVPGAWITPSVPPAYLVGAASMPATRLDSESTRVPFRIASDRSGLLILTDAPPLAATSKTPALPQVEYIAQADDERLYPADFVQLLSLKLAGYLAPTLTAGDPFKLGARAMGMYDAQRTVAQNNAYIERQTDPEAESAFIQARV